MRVCRAVQGGVTTFIPLVLTLLLAATKPVVAQTKVRDRIPSDQTQFSIVTISTPEAVRFLEQCTFGPTKADIIRLQEIGYEAFIDEQFAAPLSNYNYLYYDSGWARSQGPVYPKRGAQAGSVAPTACFRS